MIFIVSLSNEWKKQRTLRKTSRGIRHPPCPPLLYFAPLCWSSVVLNTLLVVWGLPSLTHVGVVVPGEGMQGLHISWATTALTEDALRGGAEKTTLLPAETSKTHTLSTAAHFCSWRRNRWKQEFPWCHWDEADCVLPETSGSWLRKGWVGSDATLNKRLWALWKGRSGGAPGSELTAFHLHLMAMESSSPKNRGYGEQRFRERDEQGRENCVMASEIFLSPLMLPFSIPKEENLCPIYSAWCFQFPILFSSSRVCYHPKGNPGKMLGTLKGTRAPWKNSWFLIRAGNVQDEPPRLCQKAGKLSKAGPGARWRVLLAKDGTFLASKRIMTTMYWKLENTENSKFIMI